MSITRNMINFNPAEIAHCNKPTGPLAAPAESLVNMARLLPTIQASIPTQLTFFQNNSWSDNIYNGPSTLLCLEPRNNDNPVSWAEWTKDTSGGDKCSSSAERSSGGCNGPFGQDAGSTYNSAPGS